jgi:hypothetical protein
MQLMARFGLGLMLVWQAGCTNARFYRIPTNLPWPDEWVAGKRTPTHLEIALAGSTIAWHRSLDPDLLADEIDALLYPKPAVRHYTRIDFAVPERKADRDRKTIPIVEVKIDAALLPVSTDLPPFQANWSDKPFDEAMEMFSVRFGRKIEVAQEAEPPDVISAKFKDVDPRLAFAQLLLDCDLFFLPTVSAPQVHRSFEYTSKAEFLRALQTTAKQIETAIEMNAPITIVPFAQWLHEHPEPQRVVWQLDTQDDDAPPQPVSLSLSSEPAIAKKQLARTLPDRIK